MWFENQFPYFLWMILCGIGLMFFYDLFRIRRRLVNFSDFMVNFEDILYSCLSAVAVFYITYIKNNGEIRLQTVFGLLLGCIFYIYVIGNRFVKLGTNMAKRIGKLIKNIIKIILYPITVMCKILWKPARVVVWHTGKSYKSIRYKTELKLKNLKHLFKRK